MVDQEELRNAISANVTRLRKIREWSQTELAARLEISNVHLNRIENGHATPSADLLFALADVFGVTADSFRQVSEKISAA